MAVMDRAYIVAHQVVERYLAGRLSATEAEQFEEYLLGHPEIDEELRLTEQMKLGLRTLRERGELEAFVQPGRPAWRRPASGIPLWAMAALVIVTIGAGLFLVGREPVPSGALIGGTLAELDLPAEMRARPVVTFRLMAARGASSELLPLPAQPAAIELQILPSQLVADGVYAVRFVPNEPMPQTADEVIGLKLQDDSNLHVYLRSDRLTAGEYRVVVSVAASRQGDSPAGEFLLKFH